MPIDGTPAGLQTAILLVAVAAVSWTGTVLVRRYALKGALLDIPNERSSHEVPTPRGGGAAIAIAVVTGLCASYALGHLPWNVVAALVFGGALVALAGWIDDHHSLPAWFRALIHVIAAIMAVTWLGGLPRLDLGVGHVALGAMGSAVAVVALVWLVNLFNFMDGTDALAATEATLVAAVGGVLLSWMGFASIALACWIVAAGALGFLPLNWPPASIFMGDTGSGLLGYLLGVLALASERAGAVPWFVWVLLMGVFLFDASVTLVRRVTRGERWYSAHRMHAYQRIVQAGWTHRRVAAAAMLLNVPLVLLGWSALQAPRLLPLWLTAGIILLTVAYAWVERLRPFPRRQGRQTRMPD